MAHVVKTEKTAKGKKETMSDGTVVYSGYKGSKQNNGRPVSVTRKLKKSGKQDGSTTSSTNTARHEKEKSTGRKLSKKEHVAHKSGTNKGGNHSTKASSTRVESAKKNIGDGNRSRHNKKG
jgi:hypothetical protein